VAVDIGGTFTDCVVVDELGTRSVSKAPTTPGALERGVLEAVRLNAAQLGLLPEFVLREFYCPGCATALAADVLRRDEPVLDESRLLRPGRQA